MITETSLKHDYAITIDILMLQNVSAHYLRSSGAEVGYSACLTAAVTVSSWPSN